MIPIAAATAHGVLVANVPGVNANAVAEHVLRSMLQLARRSARDGAAACASAAPAGRGARALADCGLRAAPAARSGWSASATSARRSRACAAQGLSMTVLAHTRSPLRPPATRLARRVPLPELLAQSDFVVLACPLTDATRGLIGAAATGADAPRRLPVNVARGPVVDEAALIEALQSRPPRRRRARRVRRPARCPTSTRSGGCRKC